MTRDEAIEKWLGTGFYPRKPPDGTKSYDQIREFERELKLEAGDFIDRLAAIGVLKLEDPKSVEDEAIDAIFGPLRNIDGITVLARLKERGFKITRAG